MYGQRIWLKSFCVHTRAHWDLSNTLKGLKLRLKLEICSSVVKWCYMQKCKNAEVNKWKLRVRCFKIKTRYKGDDASNCSSHVTIAFPFLQYFQNHGHPGVLFSCMLFENDFKGKGTSVSCALGIVQKQEDRYNKTEVAWKWDGTELHKWVIYECFCSL